MNGMVRFALGVANVPDHMVDDIETNIPGAQRLITAAKKLEPSIVKLAPHIEAMTPILRDEVWPVLLLEYPDLIAMLPLAQQVLEFVKGTGPATPPGGHDSEFGG